MSSPPPVPPRGHTCTYHDGEVVWRVEDPASSQDGAWVDGVQGFLDPLCWLAEWHTVVIEG